MENWQAQDKAIHMEEGKRGSGHCLNDMKTANIPSL